MEDLLRKLMKISEEKSLHLKNILKITQEQNEAIVNEDMDKLDRYISNKQKEIDIINQLDSIYTENYNIFNLNPLKDNKALQDINEEISRYLRLIAELDKENNKEMTVRFTEVKSKLKQVRQGKKMNSGYNVNNHGTMFIDESK